MQVNAQYMLAILLITHLLSIYSRLDPGIQPGSRFWNLPLSSWNPLNTQHVAPLITVVAVKICVFSVWPSPGKPRSL